MERFCERRPLGQTGGKSLSLFLDIRYDGNGRIFFQLKPVATEILAREELVADGRVRNLRVKKKSVKIITKMGQYQEALRVPSNIRTQD